MHPSLRRDGPSGRQTVLLALAMMSVAFVGCLGGDDGSPGAGPGAAGAGPGALAFGSAIELPGVQVGAEPNVITGDQGRVWVVAPGSVVEDPNVARGEVSLWASEDHGESWQALRTPAPRDESSPWCSCDTDISLGPDGTLYLTDFWVGPTLNGFVVETSENGGRTWGRGNFLTVTNLVANDRQYITAGAEPGVVFLTYARGGGGLADPTGVLPVTDLQSDVGLHVWRSDDAGTTFTPVSQPFQAAAGDRWAFIAKHRVGADGTLLFPWTEVPADDVWVGAADIVVATSRDGGQSFERNVVAEVPGGVGGLWPMQMDVGPDGALHFAWMARGPNGVGSTIWYASSPDGGTSFTAPLAVTWANGTAVLPWIAHAGPGRAVVTFYGTPAAVEPLEAPDDTRWDAWAVVVDATDPNGAGLRSGPPARASPFPVKVGPLCPQGASCPRDRELLDYPSVAWADGWAHVAYAASLLDEGAGPWDADAAPGAGPSGGGEPRGGHDTAAKVFVGRASLP